MIGEMISGNGNSHVALKKGGLAKIRVTSFVPKASGELRWLLTPEADSETLLTGQAASLDN